MISASKYFMNTQSEHPAETAAKELCKDVEVTLLDDIGWENHRPASLNMVATNQTKNSQMKHSSLLDCDCVWESDQREVVSLMSSNDKLTDGGNKTL